MSSVKDQMNKHVEFLSVIQDDEEFVNKVESILRQFNIHATYYLLQRSLHQEYIYSLNYEGESNFVYIKHILIPENEYTWRRTALIEMIQAIKE